MGAVRGRLGLAAVLVAALAAGLAPVVGDMRDRSADDGAAFPGWPGRYEGRDLTELPLTQREAAFVKDFPGKVGRFSDGDREVIIRWVRAPTRRLHASADCFRGSGYKVTPIAARRDAAGAPMGCFRAGQGGSDLIVCEMIRDGSGESWPDVSAWYWNAVLGASTGPWWSFVVAERG